MPLEHALIVAGKIGASYLRAQLDPNMRRRLAQEIEDHVLAELPRIVRLIEDRCADLEARGCTPHEANIIAYQVIEAQKRTLDEEKRARLTNVLVNGLAAVRWDKVTHRLMVRYAVELEEEHIERLKTYASDEFCPDAKTAAARKEEEERLHLDGDAAVRHWMLRDEVNHALDRELLGRGLLKEVRRSRMVPKPGTRGDVRIAAEEVQILITELGATFLEYLRTP
jgi:hypothetical protein